MKSLSNRLLLIMAAGFMPILMLQALTVRPEDSVIMTLTAAVDCTSVLLTILLALRLLRRPMVPSCAAANRRLPRSAPPDSLAACGRVATALDAVTTALDSSRQAVRTALGSTPKPAAAMLDQAYRLVFRKSLAEAFQHPCPELIVLPFTHASPEPARPEATARQRPGIGAGGAASPLDGRVTICRAITEKQQTAAALRDSEQRLRLALAGARMGVRELDLVTGAATCTPEAAAVLGRDAHADDSFDTWFAAIHPDDRTAVLSSWDRALAHAENYHAVEYRFGQADGGWRWIAACGRVMFDGDRPVRVISVVQDISARKQVEEELRHLSTELQARVEAEVAAREAVQARAAQAERMHALGQLAGGIAHDFNNVLQAVGGAIALIEHHTGDPPHIRRLLRLADAATRRGAAITRRLLALARRNECAAEPIDAADLLHELREILVHTLGPNIAVAIRLEPSLSPFIADRSELETSLINLATNARDAMPLGGALSLSAAVETVARDAAPHVAGLLPGCYMRLDVADDGTGMDTATLARATEPFFTTKAAGIGTGLGLAMTKAFAQRGGGGIAVESSLGQGTTVTLWLPVVAAEAPPASCLAETTPAPDAAPGPAGIIGEVERNPRVLLVDDDALLRETLALLLEDAGYRVLRAADGQEALALVVTGTVIDALVTDLSMPGLDGLAVIQAAQAHRPGLPAVLLTGSTGDAPELDEDGLMTGRSGAGPCFLLRKPATGLQLAGCLAALLGRSSAAA